MHNNMFEGNKVRLRGVRPDDWEHFLTRDTDSDAQRYGWQVWPPKGSEAAKVFARGESEKKFDVSSFFLVIETLAGEAVGSLSVRGDQRRRSFEYGISLDRPHWGKGYAEETIAMAARFMFGEMAFNKMQAFVYAFNKRSEAMHRKFGMRLEGTLTEAQYTDGRYWDCYIFGMTAKEFFAKYGAHWGDLPE